MPTLTIYHGSEVEVSKPSLSRGKINNDYGRGFYCTDDRELSKEWACKRGKDGFSNQYTINTDDLKILDLTDDEHTTLEWISLLVNNRVFDVSPDSIAGESREYLLEKHLIDISQYDLMIGYRADDSYFSYAQSFLNNSMSLESLEESMKLGRLGKQLVLKSEKAFENLTFIGSERANKEIYAKQYALRDSEARNGLKKIKKPSKFGRFIVQIMEEDP